MEGYGKYFCAFKQAFIVPNTQPDKTFQINKLKSSI
jgi:hypothetical protein